MSNETQLTGKELRESLRKAARAHGAQGKWVSYARNDELLHYLQESTVPDSVQQRVQEVIDKARAEQEAREAEEARLKARLDDVVSSGQMEEVADKATKVLADVGGKVTFSIPEVDPYYRRTGVSDIIEWHYVANVPLGVTGPSGSGKTYPCMQEAARAKRPILKVNFNGGVLPSTFLGRWNAKAGATVFTEGLLPLAMRNGVIVLGDEFDFAPPEISATFHPAMDITVNKRAEIYIPDTNTRVRAIEGFCVVLTCNSMGDETGVYSGTAPINGAITTRMSRVTVDYPKVTEEAAMLRKAGLKKEAASGLAKAMKDLRKAHINENKLTMPPSLRQSIRIAHMATKGWGAADELPLWLAARITLVEGMTQAEQAIAEEILQRHGVLNVDGNVYDPDKAQATETALPLVGGMAK